MLVAVDHVPIRTNPKTRESRLFPSMWSYVRRNGVSIFRIYAIYEPLRVFMMAAAVTALVGAVIWARFLWFFIDGKGDGPHPVADPRLRPCSSSPCSSPRSAWSATSSPAARVLQQRMLERVRRVELQLGVEPSHYEPGAAQHRAGAHHGRPGRAGHRQGRSERGMRPCERSRRGRGPDRQHLRQVRLDEPGRAGG